MIDTIAQLSPLILGVCGSGGVLATCIAGARQRKNTESATIQEIQKLHESVSRLIEKQDTFETALATNNNATIAQLRHSILRIYNEALQQGALHVRTLESAEKLYEEYVNLGGNGFISTILQDLRDLPIEG